MAQEENKKPKKEDENTENEAVETSEVEDVNEEKYDEVEEKPEEVEKEEETKAEESEDGEEDLVEENISEEEELVKDDNEIKEEDRLPEFRVGDTIRVSYKIIEGEKVRTQPYQGIVIAEKGEGKSKTFTVRKIGADNVGVERIFPLFSPNIEKIKVMKKGKVRRAKLYYLRDRVGRKATRIKERVDVEKK